MAADGARTITTLTITALTITAAVHAAASARYALAASKARRVTGLLDPIGHHELASDVITASAMLETPRAA